MKEKLKQIMIKGGFSVIIALVAMSAYLLVMYYSNQYFNKVTAPAEIRIGSDGEISIPDFEADEDEVIYILWETDGGNIKPVRENKLFSDQYNKEDNKWYYANTAISEGIKWDSTDADGNEYTTATIRAIIYSYNEADGKDQYYMGNYVNQLMITVTIKDGQVVKADEERYFSNPVRSGEDKNWTQIYNIDENENGDKTYRYRTGMDIEEDILILCWESDDEILSETDYKIGLYPQCRILKSNMNKNILLTTSTITIEKSKTDGSSISAYLIEEDVYDNVDNGIDEKDKKYRADFNLN